MADVLIKNVDDANGVRCWDCDFEVKCCCNIMLTTNIDPILEEEVFDNKKDIDSRCPIIKLPQHGRLIDADVLKETLMKSAYPEQREWYFAEACQFIDEAPTIIEASND